MLGPGCVRVLMVSVYSVCTRTKVSDLVPARVHHNCLCLCPKGEQRLCFFNWFYFLKHTSLPTNAHKDVHTKKVVDEKFKMFALGKTYTLVVQI